VYEKPIFAVLGIIQLLAGPYLIVATETTLVGKIQGQEIWAIKEADLIRIAPKSVLNELTTQENIDEFKYISLILGVFQSGNFYFSHTYDLTRSLQDKETLSSIGKWRKDDPIWKQINDKFVWNLHLQESFISYQEKFGLFFPPIIQGFVGINSECYVKDSKFAFALVSRRRIKRAGTRFITRGADMEGNVANGVETEQIITFNDGTTSSFLQTRGSIPLVWRQVVNLSYEPAIEIDEQSSPGPLKLHFEEQYKLYNKQIILNLLKTKGSEGKLGQLYEQEVKNLNHDNIRFISFDVHHHCKISDFGKLSILADQIGKDRENVGFFLKGATGKVEKKQNGIFRTNCKDCLDRTNLVQGFVARLNIVDQFKHLGLVQDEQDLEKSKLFMQFFRYVWADNGDAISIFYAGTPAIRGDVTRNGKQSIQGLINDGFNSCTRYYLNNMQDGNKQDGIDLLLEIYKANRKQKSPFAVNDQGYVTLFIISLLSIFYTFAPMQIKYKSSLIIIALWLIFFVFLNKICRISSLQIVDHPKLFDHNKHINIVKKKK